MGRSEREGSREAAGLVLVVVVVADKDGKRVLLVEAIIGGGTELLLACELLVLRKRGEEAALDGSIGSAAADFGGSSGVVWTEEGTDGVASPECSLANTAIDGPSVDSSSLAASIMMAVFSFVRGTVDVAVFFGDVVVVVVGGGGGGDETCLEETK